MSWLIAACLLSFGFGQLWKWSQRRGLSAPAVISTNYLVIAEATGRGPATKGVRAVYDSLIARLGSELHGLQHGPPMLEGGRGERIGGVVVRALIGQVNLIPVTTACTGLPLCGERALVLFSLDRSLVRR